MIKKIPPHLPPPVSNLSHHRLWQRMRFLLFIMAISLLVGMSGAAMILGWIWPKIGGVDTWFNSYERATIPKTLLLEDKVKQDISSRLVVVFSAVNKINNVSYFKQTDKIGVAMVVGSDGWLAMYKPNFVKSSLLYALMPDSKVYQVEKTVVDKYSGMVYLKITGGQFKVVGFNEEIKINDDLFVYQDNFWSYITPQGLLTQALSIPHLDSSPATVYQTNKFSNQGDIVVNSQGRIVGVIKEKNLLLPINYLTRVLPTVLSEKTIRYPSLGVTGWFDKEQAIAIKNELKSGFVVSSVWSSSSQLLIGDIITQINGSDMNETSLWYNIITSQKVKLKLLRNGKEIDLELSVVEQKL